MIRVIEFFILVALFISSALGLDQEVTKQELKVLVLSDFHYDAYYKPNASVESFCRISFETLDPRDGLYGRYGCDTPYELLSTMIQKIAKMELKPDLILALGDFPAHFVDVEIDQKQMISTVVNELKKAFPDILILPVIGNNDTFPNYSMPLTLYNEELQKLFYAFGELFGDKEKAILDSFSRGGYYEYKINDTSLLIMNTLPYYRNWKRALVERGIPPEDIIDVEDPLEQWSWMEDRLKEHKREGSKAIIIGHIPPGVNAYDGIDSWTDTSTRRYQKLVKEYGESIGGMIFGHFHQSEFKILNINKNNDTVFGITVPSFSLCNYNHPGFIVLEISGGMINDFTVYYSDIERANVSEIMDIYKLYTYSEKYDGPINSHNVITLYQKMKESNELSDLIAELNLSLKQIERNNYICATIIRNKEEYDNCLNYGSFQVSNQ